MGLLRLAMESIFQEDKRFEAEYKQDSRIFGFALIQLMKVVFSKNSMALLKPTARTWY